MKTNIKTDKASKPKSPIAQGTKANSFIFTTGQLGRDLKTGELAPNIEGQVERALENLKAVVEAGGGDLSTIVKMNAYVMDLNFVPIFDKAFKRYFPEEPPARVCVEVSALAQNALIVIDAIAVAKE